MKKSDRKLRLKVLLLIIPLLLFSRVDKLITENDLIIQVDQNSLVQTPEETVLSYFGRNRTAFESVSGYLLTNEKIFRTRPVILNNSNGIDKIQDDNVKRLVSNLLQEGMVKNISSLNDSIQSVHFLIKYEHGAYEQGIRYVSDRRAVDGDKSRYNYVKEYRDLGNGWFYYLYYYNQIKGEDEYRKAAWDMLTESDKKSVIYDWSKAIVTLEDQKSLGLKIGKTKSPIVVSVCFNTGVDGLLGPIVIYLDPSNKEVAGLSIRY